MIDTISRERFWAKVAKSDGCWLWTGATDRKGYGIAFLAGERNQPRRSHRMAWQMEFGEIPVGLCVLHECDVRACVRPSHLHLGTNADNNQEMMERGRYRQGHHYRGDHHPNARLSEDAVRYLRRIYAGKPVPYKRIAGELGVSPQTLHKALTGRTWRIVQ